MARQRIYHFLCLILSVPQRRGHAVEPRDIWLRYLEEPLRELVQRTPGLENGNSTGNDGPDSLFPLGFITEMGRRDLLQLAADPATRLQVMDSEGIHRVALFPTHSLRLGGVRQPQLAPALFRAYNDWLAEHCACDRERLLGIAMIPLQEPTLAVAEAERAVTERGHRGLFISPHPVDNRNLDHPAYEPLWDLVEQMNVPALVHDRLLRFWRELLKGFEPIPPRTIRHGAIQENVLRNGDVDLSIFPAPVWHPGDGGRFIGTASINIMRDPDTGIINVGTYRNQVFDRNGIGIRAAPPHHGGIIKEKYMKKHMNAKYESPLLFLPPQRGGDFL